MNDLAKEVSDYLQIIGIPRDVDRLVIDVLERINSFFTTDELADDGWLIAYMIKKVGQDLRDETNRSLVPEGLYYVWIERVAGEVLSTKKNNGIVPSTFVEEEGSAPVSAITEGDTRVEFAKDPTSQTTKENIYNKLIEEMKTFGKGKEVVLRYRQLQW